MNATADNPIIERCPRFAAAVGCLMLLAACFAGCADQQFLSLDNWPQNIENVLPGAAAGDTSDRQPGGCDLELAKGRPLEQVGKHDQARTVYERLIADYPNRYEGYHRLGVVADHQRRHREAQSLYTQAIRLQSGDAELFNDLGYCLFLQGKLLKAESALMKAVTLHPSSSRYRNNLGLVLGNLGHYDKAMEQFRHAGSEADAYYNLAFVRASQDEVEDARECFRLALAVDPAHEPAREALKSFEEYDGDPDAMQNLEPIVEDGVRWVSYNEATNAETSETFETASHDTAVSAGGAGNTTRRSTQSLLKRARAMMSARTAERQQQ